VAVGLGTVGLALLTPDGAVDGDADPPPDEQAPTTPATRSAAATYLWKLDICSLQPGLVTTTAASAKLD
jgi:hypothetical protein